MPEVRQMLKYLKQWLLSRLISNHCKSRSCSWMIVVHCPLSEMFPSNLARIPLRLPFLLSLHAGSWIMWILYAVSMTPFLFGCFCGFNAILFTLACIFLHSVYFPLHIKLFTDNVLFSIDLVPCITGLYALYSGFCSCYFDFFAPLKI